MEVSSTTHNFFPCNSTELNKNVGLKICLVNESNQKVCSIYSRGVEIFSNYNIKS